jgi:hypothetical protein
MWIDITNGNFSNLYHYEENAMTSKETIICKYQI